MLAGEECQLGVVEDWLEQSEKWLLNLIIEVPLIVDWEVILENVERVLRLFKSLGAFEPLEHHV